MLLLLGLFYLRCLCALAVTVFFKHEAPKALDSQMLRAIKSANASDVTCCYGLQDVHAHSLAVRHSVVCADTSLS